MLSPWEELRRATSLMDQRKQVQEEEEVEDNVEEYSEETEEEEVDNQSIRVVPLEDLESRKKAFLTRKIQPIPKHTYYESKNPIISKTEWKDLEPGEMSVISLGLRSTRELISIGTKTFTSMSTTISDEVVASLFLLAYNARDRDGKRIYADVCMELVEDEVEYNQLSSDIKKSVDGTGPIRIKTRMRNSAEVIRDCFCFLAGTYMRMFTKSAENYSEVEDKIVERFEHFYMANFPFEQFHPNLETAKAIKSILELSTIMKNTFYTLLHAGESTDVGKNIKAFMYVTHISFTGLHPLVLFMKAMAAFKVGSGRMANALHTEAYEAELRDICTFIRVFVDNDDEDIRLKMWRFGRIFDDQFYATLQTKHCKRLTLALSYLLRLIAPEDNQNILKIAQISTASRNERSVAELFAERAYQVLVGMEYTGNYQGLDKLLR